ncbi:MAG: hypothetical protein RLZZ227_2145 [Pseudomonadota bacterium]|jgi:hypothetical protein
MPKLRLTQQLVNSAMCARSHIKQEMTDSGCKGLLLEIRKQGGKTWYWRYTNVRGKQRLYRLGDAQVITLSQARQLAQTAAAQLAFGHDPCDERAEARQVPTFDEFVHAQYLPFIQSYKRS